MLINIDWLQLHLRGSISRSDDFTFKKLNYSTQVFKCIEDIYLKNEYVASLVSEPHSQVLHPNTVLLKIINKQLYSPTLFILVEKLIKSLNLEFIGITRLDVCADFNRFANNLHPEKHINNFMTLKIKKLGQTKGKCHFEQKTRMHYETLKFGTGNSLICSYLYNKSKELKDVKHKPYIVDNWIASGLDVNNDIWRLEFSIKGNSLNLLNQSSGELETLSMENLKNKDFITKLFYSLQYHYFRFKKITEDKNVSRWPDIQLLPPGPVDWKRLFLTDAGDVSRADKIFVKKLENMNDEIRKYANFRSDLLEELMCEVVTTKGLQDYYIKKIHGKYTPMVQRLKESQTTMYQELQKSEQAKKENQSLFNEDEKLAKITSIVLKPKKIS